MPSSNSAACGSAHAYSLLRARSDLTGVTIKEGEDTENMTSGIMISVASPGTDTGNTDGHRDLGDALILVMGVGSSSTEAAAFNAIIDNALEASKGVNTYGTVVRCAREKSYYGTGKTGSNQTRFYVGGFYRVNSV